MSAAEKTARDEGFNAGTIAALGVITAMDCPVTWRHVVEAAGVQEVLVYALLQDGDWEWAGFKRYAHIELGSAAVAKARAAARRIRAKATNSDERSLTYTLKRL